MSYKNHASTASMQSRSDAARTRAAGLEAPPAGAPLLSAAATLEALANQAHAAASQWLLPGSERVFCSEDESVDARGLASRVSAAISAACGPLLPAAGQKRLQAEAQACSEAPAIRVRRCGAGPLLWGVQAIVVLTAAEHEQPHSEDHREEADVVEQVWIEC